MSEPESESKPVAKFVGAAAAAQRMLCLLAVFQRCKIEAELLAAKQSDADQSALKTEARNLNGWLKDETLWHSASYQERSWLESRPGDWPLQQLQQVGWRAEAVGVIAWALNQMNQIPHYDHQHDEKSIVMTMQLPESSLAFIASAKLRPENEILAARELAEAWLWRARTTSIQKDPAKYPAPAGWTYAKIISTAAEHFEKKQVFKPIRNDFPALGKSYAELTEGEWQTLRSIASERLYGLNWLCGYAEDWDRVPTGT